MQDFAVTKYGALVEAVELPEPTLGEYDVLVRTEAAGLNMLDEKIRAGEFKHMLSYSLPQVLGNDISGTVLAVGAAVTEFTVGEVVYGHPAQERMGTFADRVAIAAADLAPVPSSITVTEAGSLPLVALTAWQALVERGNVQPGARVLIHAGAGGVSSIAIQLAKHLGATVATTASAGNADFVRDLGADIVIDYRSELFNELLSGYDLVLDSLGGDTPERSLAALRPGGKVIGIAGPPDPEFAKQAGLNKVLQLAIAGMSSSIRRKAKKHKVSYKFLFVHADGQQLRAITELIDAGMIRPITAKTVPFVETAAANAALADGGIRGKAVIQTV